MKIIFAGTSKMSASVLHELLYNKYEVVACLTKISKPQGRGQKLIDSPVKKLALQYHIKVLQPTNLKNFEIQNTLKMLNADIMIVIAYGLIIPKDILDIPKYGCINIHASILPRWRGATPIQHAILSGDKITGITIIKMNTSVDTGNIISIHPYIIQNHETSASLSVKITDIAKKAIINVLDNQKFTGIVQDDSLATYTRKINKQDAKIDWYKSALYIDRHIRGYNSWPVAFTYINSKLIRVWLSELFNQNSINTQLKKAIPGQIISIDNKGAIVATGMGSLRLITLQLPGKKVLPVSAISNAYHDIKIGACFT